MDPALTGGTAPAADASMLTSLAQPTATKAPATFTGEPSFVSQALAAVFAVVGAVGDFLGVDLTIPLVQLLSSDSPPWFTTLGLNVQRSEFEGMPVWALQSPGSSSEKTVVASHGGAFVSQPSIFNWLAYAAMASDTGATVIVPIYPLVPQGGTAGTVVPAMADLISSQIDQHGAENVSVFGDSAGGAIGLAALQELVRRGDPVPSHMVLASPALDLTASNPAIQLVDDPVLSSVVLPDLHSYNQLWAGGLDLTDPLVSPLYGSLAGLPPTAVYAGSRDIAAPDVLVLQDNALATPGADFTFILRKGEIHDWAVVTILPETIAVLPDIYHQLGIGTDFSLSTLNMNLVSGATTNGLVIDTPTLSGQSMDPALTGEAPPLADASIVTPLAQLNATAAPDTFTGQPSIVSQVFTGFYRVLGAVGDSLGVDLVTPLGQLISSDSPPWFTTLGLNMQRSEFEGMPVWTLQSPRSTSEETVVAVPGSAFILPPTIFHWLDYAAMANNTGATVIVPIYPLVPQGGTAGTVVPAMADLISAQIDQHGAENVSVYGDSLGGAYRAGRRAGIGASRRPRAVAHGPDFTGARRHAE